MVGFDKAWLSVAGARDGEPVSPRLRLLLQAVYQQSLAEPFRFRGFETEPRGLARVLERRRSLERELQGY